MKRKTTPIKKPRPVYSDLDTEDEDQLEAKQKGSNENFAKSKPKEPVTLQKIVVRSLTAMCAMTIYFILVNMGHLYAIFAIVAVQAELFREFVNVRYVEAKERAMPWFRTLTWTWFFVAMLYVYGRTLRRFSMGNKTMESVLLITQHLDYAVYGLYWILFVVSVLTLKPGLIRFQLGQHMWSIVTVCLVVFQSNLLAANTLNGFFWFFYPFAVVISNDVGAYFAGITLGRKLIKAPFLALSPNKTWEGFIGAFVGTMIFSFFFPAYLSQFSWYTCPADTLHIYPFPPALSCEPNPVFIKSLVDIPLLGPMELYPMQLHGLAYGLFASLVAPFGGFFASAIKRAYHMKDFDSFMPGHGGMMDRMDCQLLMCSFSAFYYFSFIAPKGDSVATMMYLASKMNPESQLEFWQELGKQLGQLPQ